MFGFYRLVSGSFRTFDSFEAYRFFIDFFLAVLGRTDYVVGLLLSFLGYFLMFLWTMGLTDLMIVDLLLFPNPPLPKVDLSFL